MRFASFAWLVFAATSSFGQGNLWDQVSPDFSPPHLSEARLSAQQKAAVGDLLRRAPLGGWECGDDLEELIKGLRYEQIQLSDNVPTVLVEAGAGCARGGQGANGAMWLIRLDGDTPVLLAGPDHDFNGWLFSIQPQEGHGYRDVVLGWHMSARETPLSYFRFDGKLYRLIGTATITWSDDGKATIAPAAKSPN